MRILEVVPKLGFGGVETYTIRLSRALVELGHEVTILSGGGPLEAQLEGTGVDFVAGDVAKGAPLELARLLAGRGCDLLNAQNYGAGRVGPQLAVALDCAYVMTVHGPRLWYQRAFFKGWSETVLTTSQGDCDRITRPFGMDRRRVRVGGVIIDPERHRRREVDPAVRDELCPPGDGPLIVHASRLDNRKAKVATALLEALARLREEGCPARLLLVGSGAREQQVEQMLARTNDRWGECARRIDPRQDVGELFNLADVVVATAITAAEAMACGVPLLAAGRTGYFGPVTGANFEAARDRLFADHGHCDRRISADLLAADLARLLGDGTAAKAAAEVVAGQVHERFAPATVAADVLSIYEQARAARAGERAG